MSGAPVDKHLWQAVGDLLIAVKDLTEVQIVTTPTAHGSRAAEALQEAMFACQSSAAQLAQYAEEHYQALGLDREVTK